ncbi:DUF934 domain-containing protein [Ideonella sp. B7]|uniref:DUF934 domain-containing protein n=1 Tax=Ideonella benzenivorans TaxID=2831643 RepID=UPI001CEC6F83|nr:DUF934 domain-containing protein [Ideonella benzenivorans]MCA6216329.1 DUF934 domain-containing protein [Ideonella benzenivorans]
MQFIQAQQDRWQRLDGEGPAQPVAHALLSVAQWQAARATWPADLPVGLALANTDEVEDLASDLPRLALITLPFPKWTDGRAYSQARLLRARLRFAGEIRATGDVLVDMLPLLARTGFTAVVLRAGENEASARRALGLITDHYQGDVREPRPQFARMA